MRKVRRKSIRILAGMLALVLWGGSMPADAGSPERLTVEWSRRIDRDVTDGEFLTKQLGLENVTAQSVMDVLRDNWDAGLQYHSSAYVLTHENAATCVNYGSQQYAGRARDGYGYNCTGFMASVLYYANGGTEEDALSKMRELYEPVTTSAFTDGTGWYYYCAREHEGKQTNIYYAGEGTDAESLQPLMDVAERDGKLQEGYVLLFWPSTGWDCHFGIYGGRNAEGLHQMYHAAGRGNHNGVRLESSIDLTPVTSEGASYVYIIPLPDADGEHPRGEPGWQRVDGKLYHFYETRKMTLGWFTEDGQWYYLDPETGVQVTGWREINGKRHYFCEDGRMARNAMYGTEIIDAEGVCSELRRE